MYLDHAASTPMRPEAREAWLAASEVVGNASSIHGDGQAARRLLEDARERLAAVIDCDPIEIVFTSGGTEAVNLAVKGLWWARDAAASAIVLPGGEHHATLDAVEWLHTRQGATIRAVPLDRQARIDTDAFAEALPGAALATALVANNEAGTVNDVEVLAAAAGAASVPLHLDAVAAFGQVPVSFKHLRGSASSGTGLVALSLSAHKVGGPVGVGAAVLARTSSVHPLLHGGGQQRGLRAGTQDVAGAAAFAVAAEAAVAVQEAQSAGLRELRDELIAQVMGTVPGVELLGDPDDRLPGNAHLLVPGAIGETVLFLLDTAGVSVSTGSACQAGVAEPSHVVLAMGRSPREAREVVRVTLGHTSTREDVAAFVHEFPGAVERARAASGYRPDSRS